MTCLLASLDTRWKKAIKFVLQTIRKPNLTPPVSDVKTLPKIEKVTGMVLIKTRKPCNGIDGDDDDELRFCSALLHNSVISQ
jgi:hypothetical protein